MWKKLYKEFCVSKGSSVKFDTFPQMMSLESVMVEAEDYKFENETKSLALNDDIGQLWRSCHKTEKNILNKSSANALALLESLKISTNILGFLRTFSFARKQ